MKRFIILLLLVLPEVHAQTISEFRQWYLDKQITNAALLINTTGNNALVSFSPGSYTVKFPADTSTFRNYQYLAAGTFHPDNSKHHFGAYVFGQEQTGSLLGLNYAYEFEVGSHTNLAAGVNLAVYDPVQFSGAKAFRYGAGVALQSKNKENYVGLSMPHNALVVHRGDILHGQYRALILQGGYTFYVHRDLKFIPAVYVQVGVFKPGKWVSPADVLATDLAFRYKDFLYINGAASVQGFRFGEVQLQRFGVGIKPLRWLMVGYQRDALDETDFKYHSIWLRYILPLSTKTTTPGP